MYHCSIIINNMCICGLSKDHPEAKGFTRNRDKEKSEQWVSLTIGLKILTIRSCKVSLLVSLIHMQVPFLKQLSRSFGIFMCFLSYFWS